MVFAVGEPGDRLAGAPLGVGDHLLEGGEHGRAAMPGHQLLEPLGGEPVGGDLRTEVAAPDPRGARVRQDQVEHVGDVLAAADQPDGRDHQALGEDVARPAGHRARLHAADVGVVRARDRVAEQLPLAAQRCHERDVGQVVAAGERVVERPDVAGLRVAGQDRGDRLW